MVDAIDPAFAVNSAIAGVPIGALYSMASIFESGKDHFGHDVWVDFAHIGELSAGSLFSVDVA